MTLLKEQGAARGRVIRITLRDNNIGGRREPKEIAVMVPDWAVTRDQMQMLRESIKTIDSVRDAVWDQGFVVDRDGLTEEDRAKLQSVGITWDKNNG